MPAARALPALAALIGLAGCAGARPAPEVAEPIPACAAYAADASVYAYCVRRQAAGVLDADAARNLCAGLGVEADRACRVAWVEERLRAPASPPRELLLAMCADVPDCAFSTMEARPAGSVFDKVGECQRYTGPYTKDCVGHVLQRWVMARPPEEEVEPVFEATADWPEHVGGFAALLRSCQGRTVSGPLIPAEADRVGCPREPRAQKVCLDVMAQFRFQPPRCEYPKPEVEPPHPPPPAP